MVSVDGLRKTWPGGVEAVRGVDFDVAAGEVFGLLGPNGAGKSTTIGMLTTTVVPTGGAARLAGFDVMVEPLVARSVSGIVFQEAVVDNALTGRRNLETHAQLWNVDRADAHRRITELADQFELADFLDRPVMTYSGGQRRRLEIARALVSQPKVLFLDEPTVGLDPRIRYELLDIIAALRSRDEITVLLTTHYLDEAERLCDRIAIMHDGRIVAMGMPAALLASIGDQVFELRTSTDRDTAVVLDALRARGLTADDTLVVGRTVTIPTRNGTASHVSQVISELDLAAVATMTRPPNLDDVYLRLTGGRVAA
jgi:ABC-2 type transport system ATP-binding protein